MRSEGEIPGAAIVLVNIVCGHTRAGGGESTEIRDGRTRDEEIMDWCVCEDYR